MHSSREPAAFFGGATSWRNRIGAQLAVVVSDGVGLAAAFNECAERRLRAEPFAVLLKIDDQRTSIARHLAPQILEAFADYDRRYQAFADLALERLALTNNLAQRDVIVRAPGFAMAVGELLRVADIAVFGSMAEQLRTCQLASHYPAYTLRYAPLDPRVPVPARRSSRADAIVVWAPWASAQACALHVFALQEIRRPIVLVADGGALPSLRCEVVAPGHATSALERAALVIDTSDDDPGSARALSRWNVPLAVSTLSGAAEWVQGAHSYEPWHVRSLFDAAMRGLGAAPARDRGAPDGEAELRVALEEARTSTPTQGPLVSAIIPTYNRRALLPRALASVAAQTYENLEIIVVNDGGEAIDDIVASSPRARVLNLAQNLGVTGAENAGIEAARGEYITMLGDDDLYARDHVARLVAVLERSGANVAHADEIKRFIERGADGEWITTGHNMTGDRSPSASELLVRNYFAGPGMMFRRTAFLRAGLLDAAMGHACDFEMWIRLSREHDFIHADQATALVHAHSDESQLSSVSGAASAAIVRRIYAKHPVTDRPAIEHERELFAKYVEAQPVLRGWPSLPLPPHTPD